MLQLTTKVLVMDPYLKGKRVACAYDVLDTSKPTDMHVHNRAIAYDESGFNTTMIRRQIVGQIMVDTSNDKLYVKSATVIVPLKEWMQ